MELRIPGEDEPLVELPLGPDREACCAVDRLRELPAQGVRLRTRALTTTLFARYLLGDLFIHGIGGAKYDELGDAIAREFFAIEPPQHLTLSLTLWLDLGTDPASPERLKTIEREIRDLTYNPDRHLNGSTTEATAPGHSADVRAAIIAKQQAVAAANGSRQERLARYHAIRRANEALQPWVAPGRDFLLQERSGLLSGLHRNALAHNREYAFVLHSQAHLRSVFGQTVPSALVS